MRARIFTSFIFIGIFIGILIFAGCKNTDDPAQYILTVTLGEGVSGTPGPGSYTHTENDVVTYSYAAQAGYGNLACTLDGASIPASGSITVTGNHVLNVTVDIDLRGFWAGRFYAGWDSYFNVTFSGGTLSGTVQSHIDVVSGNGNGSFSISNDQIEFILQFPGARLGFTGTIDSVNHLSGEWQYLGTVGPSASLPKKLPSNGRWELNRD